MTQEHRRFSTLINKEGIYTFGGETNKANGGNERKGRVGRHKNGRKGGDRRRGRYNWQMDRNLEGEIIGKQANEYEAL